MGSKGGSRHLKRMPAPAFWPLHTKEYQWAVKPSPGPHPAQNSLPLSIVLRDVLTRAKNLREAKIILAEGKVKIDGKIRRNEKFPAGLMDVVELPDSSKIYRVLPVPGKGLTPIEISKEESEFKLCRIENKTTLKGGHIQYNLHDGRNLVVKTTDAKKPLEKDHKAHDTLQIDVRSQKILSGIKFAEDSYGLVVGGRNQGRHGKITKIEKATATRPAIVTISDPNGQSFQTVAEYVLAVGAEKPLITLGA